MQMKCILPEFGADIAGSGSIPMSTTVITSSPRGGLPTYPEVAMTSLAVDRVRWFVLSGVIAVSSITFGLYWDISWHQTIGRDTFWTPAHLAIHFGGILAAIPCVYLFSPPPFPQTDASRAASVR